MNGDDWDEDENEFVQDSLETDVIACPACGAEIYEDSPRCPQCGEYVVPETRVWSGKPLWWVLLGLAGIIALMYVLLGIAL